MSFESECARHRSGCLPQGRPSCSPHLKNRPEGTALTKMREGLRTSNHGFLLTPNEASLKKNKSLKVEKKNPKETGAQKVQIICFQSHRCKHRVWEIAPESRFPAAPAVLTNRTPNAKGGISHSSACMPTCLWFGPNRTQINALQPLS